MSDRCTRDVAAILTCYPKDAELVVPGLGRLVAHDEIRRFYQASVDRFPSLQVDFVGAIELSGAGAFELQSVFKDHDGARFRLNGANLIRIAGDRLQSVVLRPGRARCAGERLMAGRVSVGGSNMTNLIFTNGFT